MESKQDKKLIKELQAMGRVKAPHDFLYQVNSRLEEKPKKMVFPVKLATAGAAFLLIISIYVLMQPEYQMVFMAPAAKTEKKEPGESAASRRTMSTRVARVSTPAKPKPRPEARPEAKPAPAPEMSPEMAMILDAEEDSAIMGAGMTGSVAIREVSTGPVAPVRSSGLSAMRLEPPRPSSFDKVKYIVSLVDGRVVDSGSEYITAEIPAAKQASFLNMIGQFDDVEKPAPVETDKETVRLQIKLIPQN